MKSLCLFLSALFLLSVAMIAMTLHPLHVGVSELVLNEKTKRIEIMVRLFTDDLEEALRKNYKIEARFDTPQQHPQANEYLKQYLQAKFAVAVNKKPVAYRFIGRETETDAQWLYAEITGIAKWKEVKVKNTLLFELFKDQEHFVHLKSVGGKSPKKGGKLSRSEPEKEWVMTE